MQDWASILHATFERNAKLRKRAHNESDDNDDVGTGEWLLDNYYWNAKTSMGNFDADDVQSIIPGFGAYRIRARAHNDATWTMVFVLTASRSCYMSN
jgi:hypothetical protein